MEFDVKARDKAIKRIEKIGNFKVTALVDDGGAFLLPVMGDRPMGPPFMITHKKLVKLAQIEQEFAAHRR